jgi:ribosomal protein L15E
MDNQVKLTSTNRIGMEGTFVKREQESVGDKTGNLAVLDDAAIRQVTLSKYWPVHTVDSLAEVNQKLAEISYI